MIELNPFQKLALWKLLYEFTDWKGMLHYDVNDEDANTIFNWLEQELGPDIGDMKISELEVLSKELSEKYRRGF